MIDILFNEHVYERMKTYGHLFDQGQEPKFKTRKSDNLYDLSNILKINSEEKLIEFLNSQRGLGIELTLRGNFSNGIYHTQPLDQIPVNQLCEILKANSPEKIDLVFPIKMIVMGLFTLQNNIGNI